MIKLDFQYFSFAIVYVLILYAFILLVFLCIRRREIKIRRQNRPQNLFNDPNRDDAAYLSFEWTSTVEDITESWMGSDVARVILLCTRVVSLLYLLFGGLAFYGSQYPVSFYYFDGWTLILTTFYFLFATFLSALKVEVVRARAGLDTRLNPYYSTIDWTYIPRLMAVACHMLFEVSCASNFLCAFGVIFQASPDSDDIVIATSISICLLFLDLGLNNFKFRFDQFPASIAWVVFYLLCIWPAVFIGSMRKWPYPFMAVDSSQCFFYYSMLFVAQFISFLGWYVIFRLKRLFLYYLEFKGILIPMTPSNPYAQPEYRNLEWDDTASQASRTSNRSRESLRSRASRSSDKGSVVVNSYLYSGDATDFNEHGVAMQAFPYGDDNMHSMSMMSMVSPDQQQFYAQQSMWAMPVPMIPPPPSMYPVPMPVANNTSNLNESVGEEEKKVETSEEEMVLSQQQHQQLELQRLQHQMILQQQQQQQQLQMAGGLPPMMPVFPPVAPPRPSRTGQPVDLLRRVPSLRDPVYLLEQQQELYMLNLLHNKDDTNAGTVPIPGASEQDFLNPAFPTIPPAPFQAPIPAPVPYPPMMMPMPGYSTVPYSTSSIPGGELGAYNGEVTDEHQQQFLHCQREQQQLAMAPYMMPPGYYPPPSQTMSDPSMYAPGSIEEHQLMGQNQQQLGMPPPNIYLPSGYPQPTLVGDMSMYTEEQQQQLLTLQQQQFAPTPFVMQPPRGYPQTAPMPEANNNGQANVGPDEMPMMMPGGQPMPGGFPFHMAYFPPPPSDSTNPGGNPYALDPTAYYANLNLNNGNGELNPFLDPTLAAGMPPPMMSEMGYSPFDPTMYYGNPQAMYYAANPLPSNMNGDSTISSNPAACAEPPTEFSQPSPST